MVYLGVDVGGAKSVAWLCDTDSHVLGVGQGPSGVRRGDNYDVMVQVLNDITDQALQQAGLEKLDIVSACFGISGYDWESQRQPHLDAIAQVNLNAHITLVNDTLLVLHAGSESGAGIALIAGTSCNCIGQMLDGRAGRAVGEGFIMGEGAGAIELVLQAKYAVAAAWTQSGSPTMLTEQFVAHLGASDPTDLIEGLVTGRYRLRADAAPLVFEAAQAGDDIAHRLVLWAAESLASMVFGVARQMHITDEAVEIVTGGSFFKAGPILIESLQTLVLGELGGVRFTHVEAQPVLGAVLLAMRNDNLDADVIAMARERMLLVG
ncbi:MAG: BadF/BadG/BcrA/BcrD ATPase family protein [Chloroflexota bacterium]